MKRLFIYFVLMLATITSVFAQIPQTFSYQAIVRDTENKIVANKQVYVYIYILQGSDEGSKIYSENHVVTTNQNGLMTLELGGGKTAYDFSSIDWSKAPYFVKTVTNVDGKLITGITPLLAVPYALYAAKAGNAEVDLSEYYHKAEIDYKLERINAQIEKLDSQLNPPGLGFSVADDKQVKFSSGNLQYRASTNTWRFAENQWDFVGSQKCKNEFSHGGTVAGSDNLDISSTYHGWIDLFGWGTSGYNGCVPYLPDSYLCYGYGENDIAGTNYDWGVYNTILNGGTNNMWRTLTYDEWNYLLNKRMKATEKYGLATVNNVVGLVLLPDDWRLPKDVTFSYGESNGYEQNIYSENDWGKMEANGAVFLPASGMRGYSRSADGKVTVSYDNFDYEINFGVGHYWSSSIHIYPNQPFDVWVFSFSKLFVSLGKSHPDAGYSVRLVQDIK